MMFNPALFLKYFPGLTPVQLNKLESLEPHYWEWNAKINVISRKDIDNLYERHVLHSLAIAKFAHFNKGMRVLDVGTGGGFPGIPLAIYFPDTQFLLVDSVGKKLKVIEALGLKNVETRHARAEEIREKFDHIVSRAVTDIPEFIGWTGSKLKGKDSKIWYLRGMPDENEIKTLPAKTQVHFLRDVFEEEFFEAKCLLEIRVN